MLTLLSYILLLATIGLALSSLKYPGFSLTLVLGVYALEQALQSSFVIFLQRTYLINVGVALVVATAAARNLASSRVKPKDLTRAYYVAMLLLLYAYVTHYWSSVSEIASENFNHHFPYWVAGVFVPPFVLKDAKDLDKAMTALVWFGALVVLVLATKEYAGRSVFLGTVNREDFLGNPLAASTFAGYVAMATAFKTYIGRPKMALLSVYAAIVCLAMYTIVVSGSRGQLLALAISGIIWFPLTAKVAVRKSLIGGLAIVALLCIVAYFLVDLTGFNYRWDSEAANTSISFRYDRAEFLLNQYLGGSPFTLFFGLGTSASFRYFQSYSHVVPVEVLAELGLVGFSMFVWLLYRAFKTAFRFMIDSTVTYDARVQMAMLASILTFESLLSLKQGSLLGSTNLILFSVLVVVFQYRYRASIASKGSTRSTSTAALRTSHILAPAPQLR